MKFIMLTKIEGNQIAVNVNSIASVEVADEESTWIELNNGSKFMVYEFLSEILECMNAELNRVKGEYAPAYNQTKE